MKKIGGMNYKNEPIKNVWCPGCKQVTTFTEWLDQEGGYLQGEICDNCGDNRQMKEPSLYNCHVYKIKCVCVVKNIRFYLKKMIIQSIIVRLVYCVKSVEKLYLNYYQLIK